MATVKITESNFDEAVMKSEKTVLLDFYADWCGPCKMLAPVLESLSDENPDIVVGKINVDDEGGLAQAFGVSAIPTLVVMKDGKAIDKQMGFMPKSELLKMLGK
ncbi:MAG: thioredoxin [Clostridia bacterium]|nr:thioredoxin [Clostridia bacterium]